MTLILDTDQVFYRLSLNLDLSDVFLMIILCYQSIISGGTRCQYVTFLVMLAFITWLKCWLLALSTVNLGSFFLCN